MPEVAALGSTTSVQTGSESTTNGMTSLDSEDFMKILIAQLQQQDPMNPMSNEAMVSQMSAIRDMEMNYTLTETLKQMTAEQRFAGAAGLIGKYVTGVVEDSGGEENSLEGVVTSVRFSASGKAILELDTGESLPLEKLTEVHATSITTDEDEESVDEETAASKLIRKGCSSKACTSPLGMLATFGLRNANGLNLGATLG